LLAEREADPAARALTLLGKNRSHSRIFFLEAGLLLIRNDRSAPV
jgi:hypothetical protein